MRDYPRQPSVEDLNSSKSITLRQKRFIKWMCGANHELRAESVARDVLKKDLFNLNQVEAHELIGFLKLYINKWDEHSDAALDADFGRALVRIEERSALLSPQQYALGLLAMHRVATPGQLGRYVFGIGQQDHGDIRQEAEEMLEQMVQSELIGCARDIEVPMMGKNVVTDVYYLTELGSDALHSVAPHFNYHARPGLPPSSRIQHELAVTEARLDIQTDHHIEMYAPESDIRGTQERDKKKPEAERLWVSLEPELCRYPCIYYECR